MRTIHFAVVFDMDGVLVDSEPVVMASFRKVAARYGVEFSDDDYKATIGRTDSETVCHLWGQDLPQSEMDQIIGEARQLFRENIASVPIKDDAPRVLTRLKEGGYLLGLGTSTHRKDAQKVLRVTGLDRFLSAVVTVDDVSCAKPAPDIFLKVLDQLSVRPQNAVVVEDSPSGILAAKRAGSKVIGLTGSVAEKFLVGADYIAAHLSEVNPALLDELLK